MKSYDLKAIKRYCQMHSDVISAVSIGMQEDWFWTAECIYEQDHFIADLDDKELKIGGISGSDWATPTMCAEFKDGTEVYKPAFTGESDGQQPAWLQLGCLSKPIQDAINKEAAPKLLSAS